MNITSTVDVPGPVSDRRERVGWYFYDWANSAFYTTVITVFLGPYLTSVARVGAGCSASADDPCGRLLHPLGIPVAPASLFAYVISVSVALQVFACPIAGALADRSPYKKQLMALFAYVGAAATVGLVFVTGGRYLVGAALLIVANVAFGMSEVVYNSFLPQIAGPDERDTVSSVGFAVGYVGGGLLLAVNLVAVVTKGALGLDTATVARYSLVSAGVWWAAFTILPLRRLRNRPPVAGVARGPVLLDGFRQLGHTLRGLRQYPLTLLFLAAFLVYNDGIQTVITLSAVYATQELKLPDSVLVPTILMVQFLAFFGAMALGRVAARVGGWRTVLGSLAGWVLIVCVAYTLPARQVLPFVALAALIGAVLGGSQALSRSLYSQVVPVSKEAEFFGLFEISDKGTSWLGPLVFGLARQATGSYRVAIFSLVGFFAVGFVLLLLVPMRRAILAAGNTPPRRL